MLRYGAICGWEGGYFVNYKIIKEGWQLLITFCATLQNWCFFAAASISLPA